MNLQRERRVLIALAIGLKHAQQRSTLHTFTHMFILDQHSKVLILESKVKKETVYKCIIQALGVQFICYVFSVFNVLPTELPTEQIFF